MKERGDFTLPGEAGYEQLTMELAKKWGADVIRDSDGTQLSDELLNSGYGIYSTICIIRDHNEWAKKNLDKLQQTLLMSQPLISKGNCVEIELLKGYSKEQFAINATENSLKYWQVYDRTTNEEVDKGKWSFDGDSGVVKIINAAPFHTYTVNFFAYRIWEEISMYNHITNGWDKEHLMQIDPCHEEVQEYMKKWITKWCEEHSLTTVVRFTSLFYNFVWIWGDSNRRQHHFTDWGSYDFSVSPEMMDKFEEKRGYSLKTEDFINQGKFHVTHMPATKKQRDWLEFVNEFVITFAGELVKIVHEYGKEAYLFYDDSWVGSEPYGEIFPEAKFDGIIKCVFSGYEVRLCSGVKAKTHEIRLHPYLFPVGLGGAPTFADGGNPTADAQKYWVAIRRALLRAPIERIGLGGYLHLTEKFPDFIDYITQISDEFRTIKECHKMGEAHTLDIKVAVLNDWGSLRPWTLSGHFHETYMHDLIHINEALAGLPIDVEFIDFEDVKVNKCKEFDVIINAGRAGSAWSGGNNWKDEEVVTNLTQWVYEGGVFLGVNEPSAVEGNMNYFQMAEVLGVDKDTGAKVCHGKYTFEEEADDLVAGKNYDFRKKEDLFLISEDAKVLAATEGELSLVVNEFGAGKGVYLSGFELSPANTELLFKLMMGNVDKKQSKYLTDNIHVECAYYAKAEKLLVINNSKEQQSARIDTDYGTKEFTLEPFAMQIAKIDS